MVFIYVIDDADKTSLTMTYKTPLMMTGKTSLTMTGKTSLMMTGATAMVLITNLIKGQIKSY